MKIDVYADRETGAEIIGGGEAIPAADVTLAFRELEALARSGLSILLAFLHARVAREETGFLQNASQIRAVDAEGAGDAVRNRTGLTAHATAFDADDDVELGGGLRNLQRLLSQHPMQLVEEILFDGLVIDPDVARSGAQKNASRRSFPAARSVVLRCAAAQCNPFTSASTAAASEPHEDAGLP